MSANGDHLSALRIERQAVLDFCADLTDAEWYADSRAAGWSVKDVVAHMAADLRSVVTPDALAFMATKDVESLNERAVAASRSRSPQQVLEGFATWTRVGTAALAAMTAPGVGRVRLRVGELGRYPMRIFPAMFLFDWHTHLRHDIAAALDRPHPPTDEQRTASILEWLTTLLEQSHRHRLAWLDAPVAISFTGPGGGAWRIEPERGRPVRVRRGGTENTAVQVTARADEFPLWGTTRAAWRDCDVSIAGDTEIGARVLDSIDLI
ncbi:maleylpyruvate isomerase family mycothiol-dependent enzyme [Nocardia tengchongensis]|uniref:maleylpyruvate isomerase family mycothiol-dependent enzyme n=1 Tax=Nocardia tengchongensis TaxID=2055889 RepID=UPI0036783F2F